MIESKTKNHIYKKLKDKLPIQIVIYNGIYFKNNNRMIKYLNSKGHICESNYDEKTLTINLSEKKIVEITRIANLPNLQTLILHLNEIYKLPDFCEAPNLQYLDVSYNKIKNPKFINLQKLKSLNLINNKIEVLDFDNLPNLQILELANNMVIEMKGLDKLSNLRKLDMHGNGLTDIKEIDKLVNLQEVFFSFNKIKEIRNLSNLQNLRILCLVQNKITKIEGLDKLINLQYLDLRYNKITEIDEIINLVNLKELHLTYNEINNIPLTIMNHKYLEILRTDCVILPIIKDFLNNNKIKNSLNNDYKNNTENKNTYNIEKTKKSKTKKTPIKQALRMKLWEETFGDRLYGSCYCCQRKIKVDNFHAGHIISEKNGGKVEIDNLKIVCSPCNSSCGTDNLEDFKNLLLHKNEKPREL
jgi:Leucine-rich repeat (LRR) protein